MLRSAAGRVVEIQDTVKGAAPGEVLHVPAPGSTPLAVGERVVAEIDWERRYRHMRLHTCMHLLCAVVSAPVTGGQIHDDRARLDFSMQGGTLDKATLEARLNALVREGHAVTPRWITDEELLASPDLVKTMSVKPPTGVGRVRLMDIPGVDLQACGGTHVKNTAEIGAVTVLDVLSKGKQNRRVIIGFAPA
jgi:misacylated tRNA(Ala) deacylase